MTNSHDSLKRECRTFTRYLTGHDPTPYVVAKYCEAHAVSLAYSGDRFNNRLVALARSHVAATMFADAYARYFSPRGSLRKKLVLVLALLEVSPPFYRDIIHWPKLGWMGQALTLVGRVAVFACSLLAATIVLLPIHILTSLREDGSR